MQSGHLASFKSPCLFFVILMCGLSMAWAGVMSRRTPHNAQRLHRNLGTTVDASKSSSTSKSAATDGTRDSRLPSRNVIITPSQQRELLEKGETTIRLSSQSDNGLEQDSKKAFHRIARRQTSHYRGCLVEEVVVFYHIGSCVRLGMSNMTGCQTENVLDLFNPDCDGI